MLLLRSFLCKLSNRLDDLAWIASIVSDDRNHFRSSGSFAAHTRWSSGLLLDGLLWTLEVIPVVQDILVEVPGIASSVEIRSPDAAVATDRIMAEPITADRLCDTTWPIALFLPCGKQFLDGDEIGFHLLELFCREGALHLALFLSSTTPIFLTQDGFKLLVTECFQLRSCLTNILGELPEAKRANPAPNNRALANRIATDRADNLLLLRNEITFCVELRLLDYCFRFHFLLPFSFG